MAVAPNTLTFGRIALVPLIVLLICIKAPITMAIALVLFLIAAATDYYDGYLARKNNMQSLAGAVFDSTADKMLVIGCLFALAYADRLMSGGLIIPAIAIIMREIFISGLREFVAADGAGQGVETEEKKASRMLASSNLAKVKTALQMAGIALLIPATPSGFLHPWLGLLGGLCIWASAGLGLYTAWDYWKIVRHMPARNDLNG
jgi:cardiolipin synthase